MLTIPYISWSKMVVVSIFKVKTALTDSPNAWTAKLSRLGAARAVGGREGPAVITTPVTVADKPVKKQLGYGEFVGAPARRTPPWPSAVLAVRAWSVRTAVCCIAANGAAVVVTDAMREAS